MVVNDQIDNAIADREDMWLGITGHNLRQIPFDNNDEQCKQSSSESEVMNIVDNNNLDVLTAEKKRDI
jgi:hypothetical protein